MNFMKHVVTELMEV